jgi:alpha-L-fucosidase 2
MDKKLQVYFVALICFLQAAMAQPDQKLNWSSFLSRNDLVYDTLTTRWEEGLFTGNGMLGAMLYMKDSNSLRLEIGRTDVVDHRGDSLSPLYAKARLPIGHFVLKPVGRILKNTARLDLWNAEARGTIVTGKGAIRWRMATLSQTNLIIFETTTTGKEQDFQWQFVPEASISSRTRFSADVPKGYTVNPAYHFSKTSGIDNCRQAMLAGGDYCTVWKIKANGKKKVIYLSVAYDSSASSVDGAVRLVNNNVQKNIASLFAGHRRWWHQYYPESFVSLPDARMESFYWIQQYKIASATRQHSLPMDLMGPWFRYTPWPAYWLNLNIQLSYSPLYTANRMELAESLLKMIDEGKENLKRNVPELYRHNAMAVGRSSGYDLYKPVKVYQQFDSTATPSDLELGNLTWMLYYYWQHYRYTMDERLAQKLFPLLKQSINYYLDVMYKEADGKWHLPYTYSPEYPGGVTRDCNYDLSLLRWGCQTLLKLNPVDSLAATWKDVLTNLVDYPVDENGLRIGRDVAFNQSHRHYSHLLMIYPLYLINWDQPQNRSLIEKSLQHWHSFKGALQGYSFSGGAAIYAMMGEGEKAVAYLNQLFDRYVKPNTMYLETGPVIETPLAAAASIQDLLLQSWEGKIRIFPAVPKDWKDVTFENLRAEGAFLISAVRKDGETKWIKIKSLAGEPCIIHPGMAGVIKTKGANVALQAVENGNYVVQLKKDEELILYTSAAHLRVKAGPVLPTGNLHFWGKKQ